MPQRDRESWGSCSRTTNDQTRIPQLGMKGTVDCLTQQEVFIFSVSHTPNPSEIPASQHPVTSPSQLISWAQNRKKIYTVQVQLRDQKLFSPLQVFKINYLHSYPHSLSWSQILQVVASKRFTKDKSSKTEDDSFLHLPNLSGCSRKRVDKGSKVNSFRTPQRVLRKQTDVYQYTRRARLGLVRTVKAGQRIFKRTLKATVREVIYGNGPHTYS